MKKFFAVLVVLVTMTIAPLAQALAAEAIPPASSSEYAYTPTPQPVTAEDVKAAAEKLRRQATANYLAINGKKGSLTSLKKDFDSYKQKFSERESKVTETLDIATSALMNNIAFMDTATAALEANKSALQESNEVVEKALKEKTDTVAAVKEMSEKGSSAIQVYVLGGIIILGFGILVLMVHFRHKGTREKIALTKDVVNILNSKIDDIPNKTVDQIEERSALDDPVVLDDVCGKRVTLKATKRAGKYYGLKHSANGDTYVVRRPSESSAQVGKIMEAYLNNNNTHPDADQNLIIAREIANGNLVIA